MPIDIVPAVNHIAHGTRGNQPLDVAFPPENFLVGSRLYVREDDVIYELIAEADGTRRWHDGTGGTLGDMIRYRAPAPLGNDDNDGSSPVQIGGSSRGPVRTLRRALELFSDGWSHEIGANARIVTLPGTYSEPGFDVALPYNEVNPLVFVSGRRLVTGTAPMTTLAGSSDAAAIVGAGLLGLDADEPFIGKTVQITTHLDGLVHWRKLALTDTGGSRAVFNSAVPNVDPLGGDTIELLEADSTTTFTSPVIFRPALGVTPSLGHPHLFCFFCNWTTNAQPFEGGFNFSAGTMLECTGCEFSLGTGTPDTNGIFSVGEGGMMCVGEAIRQWVGDLVATIDDLGVCGAFIHGSAPNDFGITNFQLNGGRVIGSQMFRNIGLTLLERGSMEVAFSQWVDTGGVVATNDGRFVVGTVTAPTDLTRIRRKVAPVVGYSGIFVDSGHLQVQGPLDINGYSLGAGIALGVSLYPVFAPAPLTGTGNDIGVAVLAGNRLTTIPGNTLTGTTAEVRIGGFGSSGDTPTDATWSSGVPDPALEGNPNGFALNNYFASLDLAMVLILS